MSNVGYALTEDQERAINAILKGLDIVVCMPTGSGKSLIFQALALSCKQRELQNFVIIIVTPLKSISFTHRQSFEKVILTDLMQFYSKRRRK
jgi:superfamily II DNA or RNA helicase